MKTIQVFGWAVIFTVTLHLAACASLSPEVADIDAMSGPELTITQTEPQKQMIERLENTQVTRDAQLNEREMLALGMGDRTTSTTKLAGVDFTPALKAPTPIKVEAGRCYASVVYPAEYKTVAVIKPIEQPPGEHLAILYETVTKKVKVTDEQTQWVEILCEDRMTDSRLIEIQRALHRGGYNPGPIDGVVGWQTMSAIKDFQKDFNLTVADQLTIETVNALDANF